MAETAQERIIRIAKAEVGYREGRSSGHWNNDQKYSKEVPGLEWSNRQAWCDTFVHWLALKADVLNLWPDVTKGSKGGSAGCDITLAAWKKAGRFSEYPATAAQVFFGHPGDSNHTGLVVRWDETYIWTIEGNTNDTGSREGDGVYSKKHRRRDPNVLGYGYPAYRGGIKSADPAWASGRKPGTPIPAPSGKRFALDWSFDPPAISRFPANVPGVLRYISPSSKKDITKDEAVRLHKAGKWIGLVYESTAGRAGQGRAAGVADAKTAKAEADALGYPDTACIFYAVDFDAEPSKVLPYFQALTSASARPVGVYGSKRVVEAMKKAGAAKWLWQTAAWSHHEVASGISFYQNIGTSLKGLGGAWDENTILGPKVPVWLPKKKTPHKPPPPPPPPPVDPTPGDLTITATFANVKCNPKMPQALVSEDLATIASIPVHGAPLYLGAEIAIPRYVDAWTGELKDKRKSTTYNADCECPVSLRRADWAVHDKRVRKMHGGVLHVTPWRPLSIVRAIPNGGELKVAGVASHFVSGGYSDHYPATKALRRRLWNEHWAKMRERVEILVENGWTVVIGFDANRTNLPVLHPSQVVATSHGIDHLIVVPAAGVVVKVKDRKRTTLNSDHDAITASFTLTKE